MVDEKRDLQQFVGRLGDTQAIPKRLKLAGMKKLYLLNNVPLYATAGIGRAVQPGFPESS
jgi:hypothetical protein